MYWHGKWEPHLTGYGTPAKYRTRSSPRGLKVSVWAAAQHRPELRAVAAASTFLDALNVFLFFFGIFARGEN